MILLRLVCCVEGCSAATCTGQICLVDEAFPNRSDKIGWGQVP